MRGTLPVGRVLGIPILINVSWFASFLLISGLLAVVVFPGYVPGLIPADYWALGLAGGLFFFISIVLHELGHCVVARHYGIPVRNITLFIFGGVSQISQEPPRAGAEFLMAIAGPAVSFALGGALALIFIFPLNGDYGGPVGAVTAYLATMNLGLGVFNLLPGFPMDGGRVLRAAIWAISGNRPLATRVAAVLGRVMAFVLMGFGLLVALGHSIPGWPLPGDPEGLWLIFIGLFLNRSAGQSQRQNRLLDYLRGYRADQIMEANVTTVQLDTTLRSLVYQLPPLQDEVSCFVERDGHVVGLVPRDRLQRVPPERWSDVTAGEIMIPADRITPASPEDDGASLLQRMDTEGLPGLPVVIAGTVAGLVTRSAVYRLLRANRRLSLLRL